MIGYYIDHQMEVIERRTSSAGEGQSRAHILEGLIIAVDNIDEVVRSSEARQIPRGSKGLADGTIRAVSEIQANAILEMPLRRLTALETEKLRSGTAEMMALMHGTRSDLADPAVRRSIIETNCAEFGTSTRDPPVAGSFRMRATCHSRISSPMRNSW